MNTTSVRTDIGQYSPTRIGNYIEGIDGLRAVAVISIIIFHLNAVWLPGGFVGVDVFYVISGFVVARSVRTLPSESLGAYFLAFYRRRILRIYPAIALFVVVAILFCVLFLPFHTATRRIEWVGLSCLAASSNFLIWLFNNDYFAAAASFQPFLHTWSLAVEEQFYLVFPLFSFFMLTGGRGKSPAGRRATRLVAVFAILSLIAAAVIGQHDPAFAFYMLPTRFWELAAGLFLQIWIGKVEAGRDSAAAPRIGRYAGPVAFACTTGLVLSFLFTDERLVPFPWAILPCISTAGLIAVVTLSRDGVASRILGLPPVIWIGKLSYSLYLWHWGVIVAMRWTVGIETPALQFTAAALTLAFSALSYYLVERPLRYSRTLRNVPSARFAAGFAGTVILMIAGGYGIATAKPALSISVTKDRPEWLHYYFADIRGGCKVEFGNTGILNGRIHTFEPRGCAHVQPHTLFIAGDSHALAYDRLAYRLAAEGGYRVRTYGFGGCALLPAKVNDSPECKIFRRKAGEQILAEAKPGDAVFASALWTPPYRDIWSETDLPNKPRIKPLTPANIAPVNAFLRPFVDRGLHIILEGPKPLTTTAPFRCADRYDRSNHYCTSGAALSRDALIARGASARTFLAAVTRQSDQIVLWQPFATLCPGATCTAFINGKPIYIDNHHLSGYGNDLLYPSFKRELETVLRH